MDFDSEISVYFEAWYAITTTISTVGYGDFKGFINVDGKATWSEEMVFLSITIVVGIILFSSVTHEIFSYKRLASLVEIMRI